VDFVSAEDRMCGGDEQTQVRDEWFEWFGPARGRGYAGL
jgi:hypothetical protein